MLADPTATERAVLGAIGYATNHALLHTDESVLPRIAARVRRGTTCPLPTTRRVLVTYDVTRLMRLGGDSGSW